MITWAREKLAESRIRWQNHRKQRTITSNENQSTSARNENAPHSSSHRSFDPSITLHSNATNQTNVAPTTTRPKSLYTQGSNILFKDGVAISITNESQDDNHSDVKKYCATAFKDLRFHSTSVADNAWHSQHSTLSAVRFGRRLPHELHSYINLKIMNSLGVHCHICVPLTMFGRDVKQKAIAEFRVQQQLFVYEPYEQKQINCDNLDLMQLSQMYKLTRVCKLHEDFDEDITLAANNCQNNEELLLFWRTGTLCSSSNGTLFATGDSTMLPHYLSGDNAENDCLDQAVGNMPTQDQIDAVTTTVKPSEFHSPSLVNIDELVLQSDVQYDIRKIIISLAQLCAIIIGASPYASRIIFMLKQRLIQRKRYEHDTQQCLIDMGFSRSKVQYALHINNNVYASALEFLIENQSPTYTFSDEPGVMNLSSKFTNNNTIKDNIESLLEIIRIYCQRNVAPSADMIQLMIEMGFDEAIAREALKASKNHQSYACEWLVGNRSKVCEVEQIDGLPNDSPILTALLASPHVQLSLSNPKIFLAYLSILEDYSSMGMWLNDAETSGIIGQVLRTYHEEKHILAINEFSQQR